jgi:hypothetical protein
MGAYPNFLGQSYASQSPIADAELCMNLYPEAMESAGAAAKQVLYPTPGVKSFTVASSASRIRQLYSIIANNVERAFAVASNMLVEVFGDGSNSGTLGSMAEDTNIATLVTNGDGGGQLFTTSGYQGYVFDLTSSAFTNPVSNVTMGSMVDGYFVALDAPTSTLKISNLLDGTTWDPTQFAQRSSQPDPWRSMVVNYNEIWLLGSQTSEVWYDAGNFPFPFALRPGAIMQQGIAATFSAAVLEGTVIWLAHNQNGQNQVVAASGYVPTRISNHAMEYQISRYTRIDDATAWIYEDQGHPFYVLNFPTAGATWVYDKNTQQWHQRGTWISESNNFDAWHPQCHTFAFGKHLVGDRNTPTVYQMDISLGLDVDGRPMRRVRRGPSLQSELDYLFVGRFQIEMETGNGVVTGQGSTPTVLLRTSKDGGQTFGNYRTCGSGPIGAFSTRVFWEQNGFARNFVPEVTVSDPVPWRLVNAFVDVQKQGAAA